MSMSCSFSGRPYKISLRAFWQREEKTQWFCISDCMLILAKREKSARAQERSHISSPVCILVYSKVRVTILLLRFSLFERSGEKKTL
jgi:hypothetical protein